ncbi:hypothetical protein E1B28_010494 [Marasmius oreades]|uniref:Extracellular membrane protein CFEM domain-containing protein n=1 Tax=Marasmius oreades TaxID=181124 RepID=A0A9P7RXW0_9AGAR|nr:uncharacterized protein E1B28_010494 [Marasmius oreades]KAG7091463.1 hypothetical protein E1B28_010494 [Marasmius oreades]
MSRFLRLKNIPLSIIFLLQTASLAWGQASQAPPTSFGSDSITGSVTGTAISGSSSVLSSSSMSSNATPTRSADLPSLSGVSSCVSNAFQLSVSDLNCSSVAQPTCYCQNLSFPNALIKRISEGCPNELATAEGLVQRFCAVASTSLSFPISTLPTSTSPSSTQPTSPSSNQPTSQPPPTSSSTTGNNGVHSLFNPDAVLGLVTAVFTAMLGSFYV